MSIKVHADVRFGNVCDVEVVEARGSTEVRFAADPHGGPECLWFCFRIERGGRKPPAGRKLKLVLKHSRNMLGITLPYGVHPVVRPAGGDWTRLGEPTVQELPDGRRLLSWAARTPKTHLDVAFCYPYGPEEIEELAADCDGFWQTDTIGVSQKGRPLVRLSNTFGDEGGDRPGLYLVARQHSSEMTGSWVLDGFLRHVATLGDDAPVVWAVPLSNIDGVLQGDYGKDNFPYDLNRAWGNPPMRHETLVYQRDIGGWLKRCRGVLGIDFHSPGGAEREGVYCFVPDAKVLPDMHHTVAQWTEPIATSLTDVYAAEKFARVADYPSRWDTPTFGRYFWETLGLPALCVETSYGMAHERVLTREHYRDIGRRFAQGVLTRLSASP
ncbi:MAG TPA: hypothetical protein VMZ92_09860 [Planctomycetota bacterium]|nr:hypothetical protein [Planctomycetota bacterium]